MEFASGHALLDQKHDLERSLPSYSVNDAKVSKSLMHYLTNFIISGYVYYPYIILLPPFMRPLSM